MVFRIPNAAELDLKLVGLDSFIVIYLFSTNRVFKITLVESRSSKHLLSSECAVRLFKALGSGLE